MLGNLMAVAFAQPVVDNPTDIQKLQQSGGSGGLREFEFDTSPLVLQGVAAFCSALRYDCHVEALSIGKTFKRLDKAEREECWRWFAYGIFCPRSKKLTAGNKFRSIDLSRNQLEPGDVASFIKTLSDPAGKLMGRGRRGKCKCEPPTNDELMLCTIKQGAKFYPTAKTKSKVLRELKKDTELEDLYQQNAWTCAVLPGIGLRWVKNDEIISTDRETIDPSCRSAISVEWTFLKMPSKPASLEAFRSFVECVGNHLNYLDLGSVNLGRDPGVVPAILKHCVNLKHLSFSFVGMNDQGIAQVLSALDGPLGRKLLSLNISNNLLSAVATEKIAQFLSTPGRIPSLQDLRMVSRDRSVYQGYASLYQALNVNKALQYLHLRRPADGNATSDRHE